MGLFHNSDRNSTGCGFARSILFLIHSAFFLLFLCSCSCGSGNRNGGLRIGIDPGWYPVDFGVQEPYVNGFAEELLIEIARYSGVEFVRVVANWDTLLDGIAEEKYDAVLTSLPPYAFNVAKYDFSHNFLALGPVLLVPVDSKITELGQMEGELVGIVAGDPAALLFQKHPDVILRNFSSIPDLLNALAEGEIEGALLDRTLAVNYVRDLYAGKLKIASSPLTDAGLHLVAPRGKYEHLVKLFNQGLDALKKKKKLQALQKKWQLD